MWRAVCSVDQMAASWGHELAGKMVVQLGSLLAGSRVVCSVEMTAD